MSLVQPAFDRRDVAPAAIDVALGVLAVIWMAEATVRLPAPAVVTALLYAGFTLRFASVAPDLLRTVLARPAVFPFPVLCLVSTLWSPVPAASLIAAAQLVFTMLVGLHLGRVFGLAGLAKLIAVALGLTMIASAANLGEFWLPVRSWEGGFLGIYTNKNALGQRALMVVLAAVYLCAQAPRRGARLAWGGLATGAALMAALSMSVTAMLVATASGTALAGLFAWSMGPLIRTGLAVIAAMIAASGLALITLLGIDPLALGLDFFGKTETLTGRTLLWQIAVDRIAAHPLVGHGYMGYWDSPAFRQETALIAQLYGGTVSAFHNFVLEVLVMLGPAGLAAMAMLIGDTVRRLVATKAGPARAWALVTCLALIALSLVGSSLYRPHEISLLLVAAFSAAAPEPGGSPARRDARPAPVTRRRAAG